MKSPLSINLFFTGSLKVYPSSHRLRNSLSSNETFTPISVKVIISLFEVGTAIKDTALSLSSIIIFPKGFPDS